MQAVAERRSNVAAARAAAKAARGTTDEFTAESVARALEARVVAATSAARAAEDRAAAAEPAARAAENRAATSVAAAWDATNSAPRAFSVVVAAAAAAFNWQQIPNQQNNDKTWRCL